MTEPTSDTTPTMRAASPTPFDVFRSRGAVGAGSGA